jgi:hypothetical protein
MLLDPKETDVLRFSFKKGAKDFDILNNIYEVTLRILNETNREPDLKMIEDCENF